jgi:protoporphyrinogen oxidase
MKKRIGIVGGGLLGMTLALRLNERGFDVSVIEGSSQLGGVAAPSKIGEYTWDRFYHVILQSDLNLISLLNELNLTDQIEWVETKTGFFTDGHLYSMSNTKEFLTFPPLTLLDKFRLGWTIFYASKLRSWQRLEKILVADWLKRLSGERTLNKIWLPLLKSKLGENYKITSASFIWAAISRMYGARRSGQKKEQLGYVDGGYATVLDSFQALLDTRGIETLCQTKVSNIQNNNEGVRIETVAGRSLEFDELILTIPCTQISGICPQLPLPEKQRLSNVTYQGVLCVALILKKPLAGYYVTNITDEWVPFTGVIEMTALVNKNYFDGNSLVYLPRYLTTEDSFWEKSDEEIKDEFLTALEYMYQDFHRDMTFYALR